MAALVVHGQSQPQSPDVPARLLVELPIERLTGPQRLSAARWMVDRALDVPDDPGQQHAWLRRAAVYYDAALTDPTLPPDSNAQARNALAAIDRVLRPRVAPRVIEPQQPQSQPPAASAVDWMAPEPMDRPQSLVVTPVAAHPSRVTLPPLPSVPTSMQARSTTKAPESVSVEWPMLLMQTSSSPIFLSSDAPTFPERRFRSLRAQSLLAQAQLGLHWERGSVDSNDFVLATAGAVEALLDEGVRPSSEPVLESAITALQQWSIPGTLAVALRLQIATQLGQAQSPQARQDADTLWQAQRDGRWPPALAPRPGAIIDGCTELHTFFAVWALANARDPRMLQRLPTLAIQRVNAQRSDGGWAAWWGDPLMLESDHEATRCTVALLAVAMQSNTLSATQRAEVQQAHRLATQWLGNQQTSHEPHALGAVYDIVDREVAASAHAHVNPAAD